MSDFPASFVVPNARSRLLRSKNEYIAFTSAWKALTRVHTSIPAGFYAAHAILLGRNLYKTFSPSKRNHDKGQPYRALVDAFVYLSRLHSVRTTFEVQVPGLTEAHADALRSGMLLAATVVNSLDLSHPSATDFKAVVTGAGQFANWSEPSAPAQFVES